MALVNFYGISYDTARRLCARIQVHDSATVGSLSERQVTELSKYLSSPGLIPARTPSPTRAELRGKTPSPATPSDPAALPPSQRAQASQDPLRSIVIEGDLRRERLANIAHHRTIGSYRGRRHANGFPARGQRTRRNAMTARKLNRLERRQFSSEREASAAPATLAELLRPLARARFSSA